MIATKRRRAALQLSDRLVDEVEQLNLAERQEVAASLYGKLAMFGQLFGAEPPPRQPVPCLSWLFRVQGRYLLQTLADEEEEQDVAAEGEPDLYLRQDGDEEWKRLVMPEGSAVDPSWLELLELMVGRAFERWTYTLTWAKWWAQAANRSEAHKALRQNLAAWDNFAELSLRLSAERAAHLETA